MYRLSRYNCALLGSYYIMRGFVYITHNPVDHHLDSEKNRATYYLAATSGIFVIGFTFATCREKLNDAENLHELFILFVERHVEHLR